eukprot:11177562-Lingulodinium_polyedra.AAC.1
MDPPGAFAKKGVGVLEQTSRPTLMSPRREMHCLRQLRESLGTYRAREEVLRDLSISADWAMVRA